MNFAVLATGPSMNQETADKVRDLHVVAVSDSYKLAPNADAVVSTDAVWWRHHPEALKHPGRKFGGMVDYQKIEGVEAMPQENATNSGLLGIKVAVLLGATRILLLGFDLHSPGSHFFGKHTGSLRATSKNRMEHFKKQFVLYKPPVEIINCTPMTHLHCYPKADLEKSLPCTALHSA